MLNPPTILAPVSPGEVLDRLSILELKLAAAHTATARDTVRFAMDALNHAWTEAIGTSPKSHPAWLELHAINTALWRIEDEVRAFEKARDFGPAFIKAARSVYQTNDKRAAQKRRVDEGFGSRLMDLKFHPEE